MGDTSSLILSVSGLGSNELRDISEAFGGVEPTQSDSHTNSTRAVDELLTASFLLGAMKLTPTVIAAVTDCLARIRDKEYFTFKIRMHDGKTVIEGAVTPDRLRELTSFLKSIQQNEK